MITTLNFTRHLTLKTFAKSLLLIGLSSCAHAKDSSSSSESNSAPKARVKGYGDFLFIPPTSMVIKNFVDRDDDRIDDRYQLEAGGKGFPLGHFYKAP